MINITKCGRCNAKIIFLKQEWTAKNPRPKPNPINVEPSDNGNILPSIGSGTYKILSGQELEEFKEQGNKLHLSHFATCPKAKDFRSKK
jgi:hypothetical protein